MTPTSPRTARLGRARANVDPARGGAVSETGRQWDEHGYWCNKCDDMAGHLTSGHDAAMAENDESPA